MLYKRIASAKNEDELKDLQIEMIDRFSLLPEPTKNLFASTTLRFICEKIGINKIIIFDDKAEITLGVNHTIEPIKIINLIQKEAKTYQLKGQNTLVYKKSMAEDSTRVRSIENLLKNLGGV